MHFVYILYSDKTDVFYRGQTADLQDRIKRHNARQEKATRHGSPWLLVWHTTKANRSEAVILEQKIKNLSQKRLIAFMKKYDEFYPGRNLHPDT